MALAEPHAREIEGADVDGDVAEEALAGRAGHLAGALEQALARRRDDATGLVGRTRSVQRLGKGEPDDGLPLFHAAERVEPLLRRPRRLERLGHTTARQEDAREDA